MTLTGLFGSCFVCVVKQNDGVLVLALGLNFELEEESNSKFLV